VTDTTITALHWALQQHLEPTQSTTLFLRARFSGELHDFRNLVCVQSFKPWADALTANGHRVHADLSDCRPEHALFDRILVLPSRQRTETRALLAQAALRLSPAGVLLSAQQNNEGARSLQADCEVLFSHALHESKFKCRVVWAAGAHLNRELALAWQQLDAPRAILDGEFISRPGVFAWDRIDQGSALLTAHLPRDLAGHGADLGCGYGYLSRFALEANPAITALDCYEAEHRALSLARTNLSDFNVGGRNPRALGFHWHDVSLGLAQKDFDFIVSNPPFHVGRADQPDLGLSFIATASAALRQGGRFYMVANQHLAYELALKQKFSQVRTLVQDQGFKVFEAIR
jgi:16S rRNA (guanine1207-N2)-methyltransferase